MGNKVIIATEEKNKLLEESLFILSELDVQIKLLPNTVAILSGSVRTSNVMGAVLIELHNGMMSERANQNIKRLIDVIASFLPILILFSFMLLWLYG